ncbi:MAG TPA: phage/plasmid primase, P4 family [Methylobacter sp.]|jgi:putative DNA primase/helicase
MLPETLDDVEFVTSDKTGSQGAHGALTGLIGSRAGSQMIECDPEPEKKSDKKRKDYRAAQEDDDKEPESKLAKHIADALVDSLAYDEIGGEWYTQTNGLWQVTSEKKALKVIMRVLDAGMPQGYSIAKLNNIKSFLMIYLLLDKWANNRHLLPMKNGVLDTKTMQLINYSHKHRFNWQLPYSFDPDAKLNVIKQWLWEASGKDLESVNIIRAFFKMALIGGEIQKFLELIGAGGTGKSTLIRLLVAFIGEKNHASTDLKNLETNRFEPAALYGKRLALISDSSRYGGEVSVLKALTGGDPVRLEKKNVQQSGSFVFDGVVVIASNEAIQTADYTSGLGRRRMPVNFNSKVTDADKAKWAAVGGIEAAMHGELAGLLNWVMEMSADEVKAVVGGINGQMTEAQRNHLVETNKIAAWMDDNIIIEPNAITYVGGSMKGKTDGEISLARREKLYANYESWCSDSAVHPVALQRFTANITDVCDQLKIDVIALDKDRYGKPIKGIAIRGEQHFNYAMPVTKKILCDPDKKICDPVVTQQSRVGDGGDPCDPINSSITITPIQNDVEYF